MKTAHIITLKLAILTTSKEFAEPKHSSKLGTKQYTKVLINRTADID